MANGYVGLYKGKRAECHADTKYAAQLELAKLLGARRSSDVAVGLAEIDGEQVIHVAVD